MIKISFQIDLSDNNDKEPLGNILISDSLRSIVIEKTYVDAWLLNLIRDLKNLSSDENKKIDILEEPVPIDVILNEEKLNISYGEEKISGDYKSFFQNLVKTAWSFIEQMELMHWNLGNETISVLKKELIKLGL